MKDEAKKNNEAMSGAPAPRRLVREITTIERVYDNTGSCWTPISTEPEAAEPQSEPDCGCDELPEDTEDE